MSGKRISTNPKDVRPFIEQNDNTCVYEKVIFGNWEMIFVRDGQLEPQVIIKNASGTMRYQFGFDYFMSFFLRVVNAISKIDPKRLNTHASIDTTGIARNRQ